MDILVKQHIVLKNGVGYLADYPHLKAHLVAQMHIHGKNSIEAVAEHYQIDLADVYAAIAYYYDNQQAIEDRISTAIENARKTGKSNFREEKWSDYNSIDDNQ
jgi:hypothetical protein